MAKEQYQLTKKRHMFGKVIFIVIIILILFFVLYERISTYASKVTTRKYYKTHALINHTSKIESKNYIIKKLSDHEGYSGNIKDIIFYDNDREEFVFEFYKESKQIIISKNGDISKIEKESKIQRKSKLYLDVYPEKYYAFEHSWKAKGEPINIVKYHKRRFEWPHACPYISLPICNGWMWYGNAFFEVEHKNEILKFHLDTQYNLFSGYDGQVYKLSLPEKMNSKITFLNVNMSSNATNRSSGWYVILPK